MIDLTPEAQQKLDLYLHRMRSELRGSRSVTMDEVEQSVREHLDVALADVRGSVDSARVAVVRDRLGPPERWLPDEERPAWRRVMERLKEGPEDWRLSYIAFGLFVASIVFLPVGLGALLLLPAFIASRAYVHFMRDRGEPLGARGWLVYPSIALVLAVALGIALAGPAATAMFWGFEEEGFAQIFEIPRSAAGQLRFGFGIGGVLFGAWWIALSLLIAAFLRPIRFVFAPLLDAVQRRHVMVLAAIGAVVATAGGVLLYYR